MSYQCLNPLVAISLGVFNGKHRLKFLGNSRPFNLHDLKDKYGQDNVFVLPCSSCPSCRRNYAFEWSIRCSLEASLHKYNYFITLTYDDYHIKTACKKDLDKFFDRLEGFKHKNKFLYFACQEEGELNHRIHFHVAIFGDKPFTLINPVKKDRFYHYHAKELFDLWTFGLHDIAPFESSCARYIAKYTSKSNAKLFMSRNIGKQYVINNFQKIIDNNFILYGEFGSDKHYVNCPKSLLRYFLDSNVLAAVKYKDDIKQLGHLVQAYFMRDLCTSIEEVCINEKKSRVKVLDLERSI